MQKMSRTKLWEKIPQDHIERRLQLELFEHIYLYLWKRVNVKGVLIFVVCFCTFVFAMKVFFRLFSFQFKRHIRSVASSGFFAIRARQRVLKISMSTELCCKTDVATRQLLSRFPTHVRNEETTKTFPPPCKDYFYVSTDSFFLEVSQKNVPVKSNLY